MDSTISYATAEERERLIFRLLLVNKWFLIPTSVAYEWLLSTSPYRAGVYNHTLYTIFYTSISLILIILLWFAHRRIANTQNSKPLTRWILLLSLLSFAVDMFYVFFLIIVPYTGNSLWFLFLPPLSLALLIPRVEKYANWVVDGTAATVLLISIYGLLLTYDSKTEPPRYVPAEYLLCLAGLMFMWVVIRFVRNWIDQMNEISEKVNSINSLWSEVLHRFPTEFFLVDEHGTIEVASKEARKLLTLPEDNNTEWPETSQAIRNALLLRFHAETKIEDTITIPDDTYPHPVKLFPTFFIHNGKRYCITLAQEENPELPQTHGILRSDRLTIAGQIAAGLAHELGNPLGVIRSCAGYLRQKSREDDPHREEYNLIEEEVKRCQNLIDRLLSLASPKRDTPAVHDLRELMERAVSLVKYQAGERIIESNFPNQPVFIFANEGQLLAVFVNLLLNALQSMEQSPPKAKVHIYMHTRGKEALVDISDEGTGIPKEEMEKIFNPFFTKRAEGTGLGLSIVHQIITGLGGRIEVASTVGAGTTFTVSIPLYEMEEE